MQKSLLLAAVGGFREKQIKFTLRSQKKEIAAAINSENFLLVKMFFDVLAKFRYPHFGPLQNANRLLNLDETAVSLK